MAEVGPDQLVYVDRRNNVLKLSQGEFVAVARLEAVYAASPLVRQIYVYGNSERAYLLAVVVPTADALARYADTDAELKSAAARPLLRRRRRDDDLHSYEIPRDILVETEPFSSETGCSPASASAAAQAEGAVRRAPRAAVRASWPSARRRTAGAAARCGATGRYSTRSCRRRRHCSARLADEISPDAHFIDLGGDSLSALTFSNLLREIFDVEVPVGVVISPAGDLRDMASYIETRAGGRAPSDPHSPRCTAPTPPEVRAADLTLDKFLDAAHRWRPRTLPPPRPAAAAHRAAHRRQRLPRPLPVPGVAAAAGRDRRQADLPRPRRDADAAPGGWTRRSTAATRNCSRTFRELAADHLEVLAGRHRRAEPRPDEATWERLAEPST